MSFAWQRAGVGRLAGESQRARRRAVSAGALQCACAEGIACGKDSRERKGRPEREAPVERKDTPAHEDAQGFGGARRTGCRLAAEDFHPAAGGSCGDGFGLTELSDCGTGRLLPLERSQPTNAVNPGPGGHLQFRVAGCPPLKHSGL